MPEKQEKRKRQFSLTISPVPVYQKNIFFAIFLQREKRCYFASYRRLAT